MTGTQSVELLNPPPAAADTPGMTDLEAGWVREHVWTKAMRRTYRTTPTYFHRCACQFGPCGHCDAGDHGHCTHGPEGYQPFPEDECAITNRKWQVLALPRGSVTHPRRTATGWHIDHAALVWLADRRCVWSCPCECRAHEPARPQPIVLVRTGDTRRHTPAGQEELFEVMARG